MILLVLLLVLVLSLSGSLNAETIKAVFSWDDNPEPKCDAEFYDGSCCVSGYIFYYGQKNFLENKKVLMRITEYEINLEEGTWFQMSVTAWGQCGEERVFCESNFGKPVIFHSDIDPAVNIIPASDASIKVKNLIYDTDNDGDVDGSDLARAKENNMEEHIYLKFGQILEK